MDLSSYWDTFSDRGLILIVILVVYVPAMLLLVKLLDFWDKRYNVTNVEQNPIANAVYAGLKDAALILSFTWILVEGFKILFL